MNHALLFWEQHDGSSIWDYAMERDGALALYAPRYFADNQGGVGSAWFETFIRDSQRPSMLESRRFSRYEPTHREQFLTMCQCLPSGHGGIVLPHSVTDDTASELLDAVHPVMLEIQSRYCTEKNFGSRHVKPLLSRVPNVTDWLLIPRCSLSNTYFNTFFTTNEEEAKLFEAFMPPPSTTWPIIARV